MPYNRAADDRSQDAPLMVEGTVIDTLLGPKRIELLTSGDLLCTKDGGHRPLRHIQMVPPCQGPLFSDGAMAPIWIKAGAVGPRRPHADLWVSPELCILLEDWRCSLLFGEDEMLAPARTLLNDTTICSDEAKLRAPYFQLQTDRSEIVFANGLAVGSDYLVEKGTSCADGQPFCATAPQAHSSLGPHARAVMKPYEADVFLAQ